jgi:hypothetical protein
MVTSSAGWLLSVGEQQIEMVTDTLFSLDEPWRSRFLALVARTAIGESWNGSLPERTQIATWLRDLRLYRDVTRLLEAWPIPDR